MIAVRKKPIKIESGNSNNYSELTHRKIPEGDIPNCDIRYMKWHDAETYDYLVEMTEREKSLADVNELDEERQSKINLLKIHASNDILSQYPEYKQINAALGIYDETQISLIKKCISNVRTKYYAKEDIVNACETIECVQGVRWND